MSESSVWLGTPRGRIALAAGIVLIAAAVIVPMLVLNRMGSSARDSIGSDMLSSARPGQAVTAIVRLGARDANGTHHATLIEPIGDTYVASSTVLRVRFADDLEVMMGGRDAITPGAVLQVTGTLDAPGSLLARRAVVLTGYVTVQD